MKKTVAFFSKYLLLIIILVLLTLIIIKKNDQYVIPISNSFENYYNEEEYLLYVSDKNGFLFPLNVIVRYNDNLELNYYDEKVHNQFDKKIYTLFSLLTNLSNYLPLGVTTICPKNTRIINYELNDGILILNVSKEFLNYNKNKELEILKIITYTFTELNEVEEVILLCENSKIPFKNYFYDKLTKDRLPLNIYINDVSTSYFKAYKLYYYTEVNGNDYLIPVTVYDNNHDFFSETKILNLLTNTFSLPLKTYIISEDFSLQENLASYQYYLSCFANNIIEIDKEIDIKKINFYVIEFY
ncbi:MAG TPA: GerMN domain-containing protein [Haloplasmataceae bacterium]